MVSNTYIFDDFYTANLKPKKENSKEARWSGDGHEVS